MVNYFAFDFTCSNRFFIARVHLSKSGLEPADKMCSSRSPTKIVKMFSLLPMRLLGFMSNLINFNGINVEGFNKLLSLKTRMPMLVKT